MQLRKERFVKTGKESTYSGTKHQALAKIVDGNGLPNIVTNVQQLVKPVKRVERKINLLEYVDPNRQVTKQE